LPLPAIAAGALTVANAAEVMRTATVLRKRASLRG
jgi:hypothetical protein